MDTPETRWLDPREQRTWIALGSTLVRLVSALDAQMLRDAGITQFDYLVMSVLSMTPERRLRMSELAELTDSSLSRLSNVASRLERRGWIHRTADPDDGRSTLAVLTPAGWDKVEASAPGHVNEVRRLVFDPLNKVQQRQLADICLRILHAVDPHGLPPDERARALLIGQNGEGSDRGASLADDGTTADVIPSSPQASERSGHRHTARGRGGR